MAGGGPIHYIPRPRAASQRGGIGSFRKAVARLGHFARPFAEGLARTVLPIGVKKLKKVGAQSIKAGANLLKKALVNGNKDSVSGGQINTAYPTYFPLINQSHTAKQAIPIQARRRKSKLKKGGRKKK